MDRVILVRYGEIALKGLNRHVFEEKLIKNIKRSLYSLGKIDVEISQSRIYIKPQFEDYDFEEAVLRLVKVFGIVSVSVVSKTEPDFEEIKKQSLEVVRKQVEKILKNRPQGAGSRTPVKFKVEAKRGDKKFPLKSPEICSELGAHILRNIPGLRVEVHNPDFILFVEVREKAYIYCDIVPAFGGIPVGTSGKGMLLLSGGIDSPVAGWMMAKRGMEIEAVHFYSYPYTSERAKEKVIQLAKILARYCYSIKLHIVPFTDIQLEINDKCPHDEITLIMRRAMMRIAERIAENNGADALITGESLGQVASQTLQSLVVTNSVVKMPVFRPLIGMDKTEVIDIARKIETFETSILPYEDCCTIFVARHPKTKPKLKDIEKHESGIRLEELLEKAINNTETITVTE